MISFEQIRDSWLNVISFPFSVGVARVYMFFLISGFCIHLAWCKSKLRDLSKEPVVPFLPFWKRRLWRLYPTYLIALRLYFLVDFVLGKIAFDRMFLWDLCLFDLSDVRDRRQNFSRGALVAARGADCFSRLCVSLAL